MRITPEEGEEFTIGVWGDLGFIGLKKSCDRPPEPGEIGAIGVHSGPSVPEGPGQLQTDPSA